MRRADGVIGALKVLHTDHWNNAERRRRMAREVTALERAGGDGVPAVLEHNVEREAEADDSARGAVQHTGRADPLYFVSAWVEGRTLQQLAGGKPLALDHALSLVEQLVSILGRCHRVGVVHRDVKPDNVLVDTSGQRVTLVDFGIAWTDRDAAHDLLTDAGQELGNRFLRLPDLAPGRGRRDARSDLTFAVGILWFVLTGRAPRTLADERGLPPHEAMREALPPALTADPRWPYLQRVFGVGFQPDVARRYQTADDLLGALARVRRGSPTAMHAPPAYEADLAAVRAVIASAVALEAARVQRGALEVACEVENALEALAAQHGFASVHLAGRAQLNGGGHAVYFSFDLSRPGLASRTRACSTA